MTKPGSNRTRRERAVLTWIVLALGLLGGLAGTLVGLSRLGGTAAPAPTRLPLTPRQRLDASGFLIVSAALEPWGTEASLADIRRAFDAVGRRNAEKIERDLAESSLSGIERLTAQLRQCAFWNYEGRSDRAYEVLQRMRAEAESDPELARKTLATILFFQGVVSLRQGETDNCVACRGETSCILPIAPAARHADPDGSRRAIRHFTEYLEYFPDDLEARWLLNLAHMTLGTYPEQLEPRHRILLDRYEQSQHGIGRFRDAGHLVGVNRFNQAGGAVMDDFDNDGLLDIVTTSWDAAMPMAYYHNEGDGTFRDRAGEAGLEDQLGGLYLVQADYDNDGFLDLFVCRGAWLQLPMPQSLLHNQGDGTFCDVTEAAGLAQPANSNSAAWADYDNDGFLDLFLCCEQQTNRLYRNRGDGTFVEVGAQAGLSREPMSYCKGAAWIDHDNDGFPDLFVNRMEGPTQFYHNNRDGTFTERALNLGIDGPRMGFSCWAFDYDNDGWLDLFATSYDRTLQDVVKGLLGQPHQRSPGRLYRNVEGKRFENLTRSTGLDLVFATMGSNYADFDNDGFLDFYLATGEPDLATLVPNRLFRNLGGRRFAEITGPSGTGHLQKGHGVACGDWDRDGDVDLFIEMGGATPGDRYHNVLFQNPGQGNHALTVKLIGQRTNRAAIGARIQAVVGGEPPLIVHRHVSSGSSFGGNPLEQTIGLGPAPRVARLEIQWPASGTTQVFEDLAADQVIEITEFADSYRSRPFRPIPLPE